MLGFDYYYFIGFSGRKGFISPFRKRNSTVHMSRPASLAYFVRTLQSSYITSLPLLVDGLFACALIRYSLDSSCGCKGSDWTCGERERMLRSPSARRCLLFRYCLGCEGECKDAAATGDVIAAPAARTNNKLAVVEIAGGFSSLFLFGEFNLRPPALLARFLCMFGLAFSESSILHRDLTITT